MVATDQELIERFIAEHGVQKIPRGRSLANPTEKYVTQLGPHSPRHRYNIACAYARVRGLGGPVWTDVLEAELLEHRRNGLSYRKIAKIMGKTKPAIQARVRYLKLGRRLFAKAA